MFGGLASALGAVRAFGKSGRGAVFGFPPQKATYNYSGAHMHPGRVRGYPNPIKRQLDKATGRSPIRGSAPFLVPLDRSKGEVGG